MWLSTHLDVPERLVRELLAEQRPQWADLSLRRIEAAGTHHALFRLGDEMVVRLPRVDWAVGQIQKEWRWLPVLAPHLPLAIPEPVWVGEANPSFPWTWGVYRWLAGESPDESAASSEDWAGPLADFLVALRNVDASAGPSAGPQNLFRGVALGILDRPIRKALEALRGRVDVDAAEAAWNSALRAPIHDSAPTWVHGDLHAANLLSSAGRLCAVIDFGLLGVGDPAADLMVAWTLFTGKAREVFRTRTAADEASWRRGRGWALYSALIALPYYWDSNAQLVAGCKRTLREVLRDNPV